MRTGNSDGNIITNTISVVLDVSEAVRSFEPIHELFAVLDMREVVLDTTLEDVGQGVLPHELVREDPDRLAELVATPKPPQIRDGVNGARVLLHELKEIVGVESEVLQEELRSLPVLLDVAEDGLTIVLGDVFRFVFGDLILVGVVRRHRLRILNRQLLCGVLQHLQVAAGRLLVKQSVGIGDIVARPRTLPFLTADHTRQPVQLIEQTVLGRQSAKHLAALFAILHE